MDSVIRTRESESKAENLEIMDSPCIWSVRVSDRHERIIRQEIEIGHARFRGSSRSRDVRGMISISIC